MKNFDTEPQPIQVSAPQELPSVIASSGLRTDLYTPPEDWNWQHLRDYVCHQIESRFGPFPRDPVVESSIFKSFAARWDSLAGPIAVSAFEAFGGYWRGAPISVRRFAKGNDATFARVIASTMVGRANEAPASARTHSSSV